MDNEFKFNMFFNDKGKDLEYIVFEFLKNIVNNPI